MNISHLHNQNGSVITAAAVSSGVLSILIAGYLTYMSNEHNLNLRSHRWTQALHLAEAGVEIGFAELNYPYFQGGQSVPPGFQASRGWSSIGSGAYKKAVEDLTDSSGKPVGKIVVVVTGVGSSNPQILAVGTCATTPRGPSISRGVRVRLAHSSMFPVALMSKKAINLNGNNIYTDSFNSSDPAKSTNGRYDPSKRQPFGHVASNDVLINTVNIGNADVFGEVYTGPGGTVAMGPNGSIGPTFVESERATTVAQAEANGWVRHDFAVDVPDASLPGNWSPSGSYGNINNVQTITAGDWTVGSINLSGNNDQLIISGPGTVRLHVTGEIKVSGNASIILTNGATLQVYAASTVSIAGNGVVNGTGLAENNQFFGLPTSTSWSISGNGQWIGTIYAPQADLFVNGGGSAGDMSGAVVAKSVTLNGHVRFHYDERLKDSPFATGYLVASWESLREHDGVWVPE